MKNKTPTPCSQRFLTQCTNWVNKLAIATYTRWGYVMPVHQAGTEGPPVLLARVREGFSGRKGRAQGGWKVMASPEDVWELTKVWRRFF